MSRFLHFLFSYLDRLSNSGHPVPGGGGGGNDGVRNAGSCRRVLGGAAGVQRPRRSVFLSIGLVVGGGRGRGALDPGSEDGGGSLQAEGLQVLAGAVGEAVGDLGLWPDLQEIDRTYTLGPEAALKIKEELKQEVELLNLRPFKINYRTVFPQSDLKTINDQ